MNKDHQPVDPHLRIKVIDYLSQFVSEHRREQIDQVLAQRTRYLTVVLEDIYQSQNASAVLRSCDCFGIQDLHVIENRNPFRVNKDVVQGASKWVDIHRYGRKHRRNTTACLEGLRERGYRLAALAPDGHDVHVDDLPLDQPTALLFGSEEQGLSRTALELADVRVRIPMFGFTRSFNISVSAAITLYHLTKRLRNGKISWSLPEDEVPDLKMRWYMKAVKQGERLARRFLEKHSQES